MQKLAEGESELLATRTVLQVLAVPNRNPKYQQEDADTLRTDLKRRKLLSKHSPLSHFLDLLMEVANLEVAWSFWVLQTNTGSHQAYSLHFSMHGTHSEACVRDIICPCMERHWGPGGLGNHAVKQ